MSSRVALRSRCRTSTALCCSLATFIAFGGASGEANAQSFEGFHQASVGIDAVSIFNLADTDPLFFGGEIAGPGVPVASATVSCALSSTCPNPGAIWLTANGINSARNLADVEGVATVTAIAHATGTSAAAKALVSNGVREHATGINQAEDRLDIGGSLTVGGLAHASATSGDAVAHGKIAGGVVQTALATSGAASAIIDVHTDATLAIDLGATAVGPDHALATAWIASGIEQHVVGFSTAPVAAKLTNDGKIDIDAHAHASGATATAAGFVNQGVGQFANGTDAHASMVNGGTLDVEASGQASGAHALANGLINIGLLQSVNGADAHAALTNDATIDLTAIGKATATANGSSWDALAEAELVTGIAQQAVGGQAAAALVNATEGLINIDISAGAKATNLSGTGGDAFAYAQISDGVINQQV